jgi:hypothetical protein
LQNAGLANEQKRKEKKRNKKKGGLLTVHEIEQLGIQNRGTEEPQENEAAAKDTQVPPASAHYQQHFLNNVAIWLIPDGTVLYGLVREPRLHRLAKPGKQLPQLPVPQKKKKKKTTKINGPFHPVPHPQLDFSN